MHNGIDILRNTLLVGMQTVAVAVENSVEFP